MQTIPERRRKPRIACDYPVIVEGYNGHGKRYQDEARLTNLSASGSYMIINREITLGGPLSMVIYLADTLENKEIPKIKTNGVVVRSEIQQNGSFGIAVVFKNYRFL